MQCLISPCTLVVEAHSADAERRIPPFGIGGESSPTQEGESADAVNYTTIPTKSKAPRHDGAPQAPCLRRWTVSPAWPTTRQAIGCTSTFFLWQDFSKVETSFRFRLWLG